MIAFLVQELFAISKRDRIDHEVVVKIVCVQMGGDQDLVVPSPHAAGGLQADLVGLLGSDLPGPEALIAVVGHIAAGLAEALLGGHHICVGLGRGGVQGRNEKPLLRFLLVGRIAKGLEQIISGGLGGGLLGVIRIIQHLL